MTMNKRDTSPAPGRITFLSGSLKGKTYSISKATTIGREPNNDIVLAESSISRNQAQIIWSNGQWYISNVSQQDNMSVNQQGMRQAPLHENDMVSMGPEISFRFQRENGSSVKPIASTQSPSTQSTPRQPSATLPPPASTIAAMPVGQTNPSFSTPTGALQRSAQSPEVRPSVATGSGEERTQRASLDDMAAIPGLRGVDKPASTGVQSLEIGTNTDREKQTYPLNKQIINIGRDPSNDIVINRPTVSAFHAQIVREGNQLVFIHPHPNRGKTLNGITYQGKSIGGIEAFRRPLARGDVFRISDEHGTFVTLAYNDGSGAPQEILP